jgi:NADH-quinone oxidoreductase subunit J
MNFGESIFILAVFATISGAALAVLSGSVVYALMGLISAMLGVAALYVYLNSPFLSMMQILIYVGAVSVLIAFAAMLAGPLYRKPREWTTPGKFLAALAAALISLSMFIRFVETAFPRTNKPLFVLTTKDIGRVFFDELVLPFELVSLLLVVAVLGATMLAIFSRGDRQ